MEFRPFTHDGKSAKEIGELMYDLQQTQLGRDIVKFLADQKIEVYATKEMGEHGAYSGFFNWDEKRLYIGSENARERILHFFAHEARHVGQWAAENGQPYNFSNFDPVNVILRDRIAEMDADAFAVYFLHQHTAATGHGQYHFIARAQGNNYRFDRLSLYTAFDAAMSRGEGYSGAMRSAFKDFMDTPRRVTNYTKSSLSNTLERLSEIHHVATKGSDSSRASYARLAKESTTNEKYLEKTAKLYGGVFAEFGVPDYLADFGGRALRRLLVKPLSAKLEGGLVYEFKRAQELYRWEAGYFRDYGAPQPSRKPGVIEAIKAGLHLDGHISFGRKPYESKPSY